MKQIFVTLKNDVAELEKLSQIIAAFGQSHDLVDDFLHAVNLSLDEILTNVIYYGYTDDMEHQINVCVKVQENELIAEVTDDARPFNPVECPPANVESAMRKMQVGGLGIHLARTLMDSMEYRRERDKNILIMKKRIAS